MISKPIYFRYQNTIKCPRRSTTDISILQSERKTKKVGNISHSGKKQHETKFFDNSVYAFSSNRFMESNSTEIGEEHQPVEFEMQNITNFEQQQRLLVATEQGEQIISR